ncbi:MAG: phosphocholine cytidylyltransferase family protein [Gammaproteobacteria bacterium]
MKAIILAAGRGSRMKKLTDESPKCLIELYGKPLIELQLEAMREANISEIAVVSGYKREMLAKYGLVEFYNSRWFNTQMVKSLTEAEEWLEKDTCIVSYSDIFYDATPIKSLININSDIAITYDPNWLSLWSKRFDDPLIDAETFRLNIEYELIEIGGKPKSVDEVQGQYMGLLRFTPNGWQVVSNILKAMPAKLIDTIDMTSLLQKVIAQGNAKIKGIPVNCSWGEIDTGKDLSLYQNR